MSRKGDPYDNAVAENFFICLKCELIHLKHYQTRRAAQNDVFAYLETFYNTLRPHSALGWISPLALKRSCVRPSPDWRHFIPLFLRISCPFLGEGLTLLWRISASSLLSTTLDPITFLCARLPGSLPLSSLSNMFDKITIILAPDKAQDRHVAKHGGLVHFKLISY